MSSPVAIAYGDVDPRLCARDSLEWLLTHNAVDFPRERDAWREVIALARAGDYAEVVQRRGGVHSAQPPEGISWPRWAEWVDLRLTELADDPTLVAAELPRYGERWQLREGVLDPAARDHVRAALSRLVVPRGSSRRDYVVVEAAHPVGLAVRLDRDTGGSTESPTRRVGVVVERTDRVRVLGMHAADALEDPRAPGWCARWPTLASTFGGWFSQAAFGVHLPWTMQLGMLELESDEHLERLAAEGAELLALDDGDLRAAVAALGCYVEPSYLRRWLGWMFWRIGHFDWK